MKPQNNSAKRSASTTQLPRVAILLSTYNGEKYLAEQLDSFARQSHTNWTLWASDDGSQDNTQAILKRYQQQWDNEKLIIIQGPAKGCTGNFLSLTAIAKIQADYYAYSDQDDIWEADKLERAIAWLRTGPKDVPALYCSRTRYVDANNNQIGFSQLFKKPPAFANALMQNIASGNTMVFNDTARKLLCEAGEDADVFIHDWWTYLLISGCGGNVFYDPYPSVRYRQHEHNLIGMNAGWSARLLRIRKLFYGRLKDRNSQHILALQIIEHRLATENRKTLDQFSTARQRWLLSRLFGLKRSGIYRQTLIGNIGIIVGAILGKL